MTLFAPTSLPANAPVTIPDIARRAGVGTATVDRVLNGRPGVNAETTKKVLQAVADLGTPPVVRGRPRKHQNLRFAYVLPDGHTKFIDLVERLIAQQAGEFRHANITEVTYCFNADDPERFASDLIKVEDCEGIAILAPDLPAVKQAINEKVRAGVHVVTLLSDVAGSIREVYVGPDNRAAGRTAGLLLARMSGDASRDTLLVLSHATRLSSEIDRRVGFSQIIEDDFKLLRIVRTPDLPMDDEGTYSVLMKFFQTEMNPVRLAGIYSSGSACTAGVVRALNELGIKQKPGLVVHELTDIHQTLLGRGELAYVLDQDNQYCISTAAKVLRDLCENVRGAIQVVKPRIEILTAENYH
jgi:LacI family transcriptional regulator